MMDLMSVNVQGADGTRLYVQVIYKVLREMRLSEQHSGGSFNYSLFKKKMDEEMLTKGQLGPLKQRLDVLESFMNESHAKAYNMASIQRIQPGNKKKKRNNGNGPSNQAPAAQNQPTYGGGPPPQAQAVPRFARESIWTPKVKIPLSAMNVSDRCPSVVD